MAIQLMQLRASGEPAAAVHRDRGAVSQCSIRATVFGAIAAGAHDSDHVLLLTIVATT